MTQQQFINFYENYKRGSYTKMTKQKTRGNYKKVTSIVVRFVNYFNIKAIKEKGTNPASAKPREYEKQIIPHVLKLNTNTNNLLLCAYKTNQHKPHTKYYYNDNEITAEEYYAQSGDKLSNADSVVFNIKLNDIISIGK